MVLFEKIQVNTSNYVFPSKVTKIGVGSSVDPSYTLDVTGTARFSSNVVVSDNMLIASYNKALATTVNAFTNICDISATNGGYTIHLDVIHSETGSSETRTYIVPVAGTTVNTTFYRLNPLATSGAFGGTQDWGVDICVNSTTTTLRLVRVAGTASSVNFTCVIRVLQSATAKVTVTESSTTGTSAVNSGIFPQTPLIQLSGNIGIGTTTPGDRVHVAGASPKVIIQNTLVGSDYTQLSFTSNEGSVNSEIGVFSQSNFFIANKRTGSITFETQGAERMRIDSVGNIGIGSTVPAYKLDVSGTVKATAFIGNGAQLTGISSSQWTTTGNDISYTTGNVGVGTTASATHKLDVLGTVRATSFVGNGAGLTGLPSSSQWTTSSPNIYFTGGNVGIGTNNPQYTLDVNSFIGASRLLFPVGTQGAPGIGTSGVSNDRIVLSPGSATAHAYTIGINGGTIYFSVPNGCQFLWYINGAVAMTLDANRNLTVGGTINGPFATPSWTTAPLQNSWVSYDNGFAPPAYYKDVFGRVFLRGMMRSGTVNAGVSAFILPVGFRPVYHHIFVCSATSAFGEVRVLTDGSVSVAVGNNTWISLDNISFPTF
jgi:hypothetical protein